MFGRSLVRGAFILAAFVLVSRIESATGKTLKHGSKLLRDLSLTGRQHYDALPSNLHLRMRMDNDFSYKENLHPFDKYVKEVRRRKIKKCVEKGVVCATRTRQPKDRIIGYSDWDVINPCCGHVTEPHQLRCRPAKNPAGPLYSDILQTCAQKKEEPQRYGMSPASGNFGR